MINETYAQAYTEVLEIIKHLPEEEYAKIPEEKIQFFKNNMDKNYIFTIDPEIDLSEQNISQKANAIVINIFMDYFANEQQKVKIKEILDLNQKIAEQKKREKYNPDDLFKNKNNQSNSFEENNTTTAIIEYKESFFTKFKNFIFKILHLNK